ncbi:DeoR/GlpR family DNA-binding transcription regulator [Lacticaseibacillus baoqingensis]|uniref:Lactose phosphotransferase system repressor n=1 Tax=Lacticaseibacillus baoqingensis TaxID=2486013 RepID=A0ABW4E6X6_9LACO|nr:DeoR/GlpR family DNA-binding transcription regulator [Lacticaseibacillus baoqingensis]
MDNIREMELLAYLDKHKTATHTQLCQTLHCSLSTLRRILIRLEDQGLVRRLRGGVIIVENVNTEYSHIYRSSLNVAQKKVIGELARDFINPGMCIFLESSSTVYQMIPFLAAIPNLIIVTNGLQHAQLLSSSGNSSVKIYLNGGEIKINSSTVNASFSDPITDSFNFNVAFFSARGIDPDGIYEANFNSAEMKKNVMKKASKNILLVDHSKFDTTHFFKPGRYLDYDAIITDAQPASNYIQICEDAGVDLVWPS